jgi:hypothetical protein
MLLLAVAVVLTVGAIRQAAMDVRFAERLPGVKSTYIHWTVGRPGIWHIPKTMRRADPYDFACGFHLTRGRYDFRQCLLIDQHGSPPRVVEGGYRLIPHARDRLRNRFNCFGIAARAGRCVSY